MPPSSVTSWVLSDPSKGSLLGFAHDLQVYLRDAPDVDVGDIGCTLAGDRRQLGYRAVLAGRTAGDFERALAALELGAPAQNLVEGFAERREQPVFVFAPHGPEWAGMGRELLDVSDTFSRHIHACEEAFEPFLEWSLLDVLRGVTGAPGLERCDVAQPAIFAVSIALAELLRAHGVEPAATMGHSIGDVPAAYMAGGLSLEDAARVMALWSQAQETLRDRGGMASVQLPPAELLAYLERWSGHVNVAAYNGPGVTVVTGERESLRELLRELHANGVRAQQVSVPLAAHSPHIDEIHERMLRDLAPIAPRSGRLPFYSSFTGGRLDTAALDAAYWPRALREVVEFERATRAALAAGHRVLIEVSPHPVLTFGMRQTAAAVGAGVVLSSMRRGHAGPERVAACLAEAWVNGVDVEWSAAFDERRQRRLELPRGDASRRAPGEAESVRERLLGAPAGKQEALAVEVVRNHVAAALGLPDAGEVPPARPFKELGVDSASAVELSERLSQLFEIRLPPTAAFDHPTSAALAKQVLAEVLGVAPAVAREVRRVSATLDEPIAIVGIGCRFPGEVASAEDLWRLLDDGADAIGSFPEDRGWELERLYDPDPDRPRTCYVRTGGFLYDASEFDAEFFGISPREALGMDPQQRLLLQVAWEALEHGEIDPLSLRGSDTGVFAGMFPQEYGPRLQEADLTAGYSLTGSLISVASGRVAYAFGLQGPALTIDTACSSSLVAVHQACAALRHGECSLALAGGVTVLSTPGLLVEFSRQRGLAPDGRCKAFGAGADGTGFAEGAALLALERLSDARRAGRRVLAVVRGSAVNQDGASNGLTAPNGPAQERVIRQALANAQLSAADVDAAEAHGTGTTLGDPIEARALIATYGQERANGPLYVGSLKSNIGHTNAAAGVAGVIKMVQALRHERLPRSLHCEEPSPHVDWSAGAVALLREPVAWPAGERVRRAGVSSFGISGTNAHLILEEAPRVEAAAVAGGEEPARAGALPSVVSTAGDALGALPFVVSAAGGDALGAQAGRLASFLQARAEIGLADVAGALARRARLAHRAVVVAGERGELVTALRSLERGELAAGVVRGVARDAGRVAFLFSGQGSQWLGMGAELQRAFPVFADALAEVCAEFDRHLERPLLEVMFAQSDPADPAAGELLANTRYTQVALFALEVSLYRLVHRFGLEPDYLIGHSIGEFAAAHVAGVLSLADACLVVAERARLMGALPRGGAMLAVEASEEEAFESLASFDGRLALAAVNGPRAVTVSGEAQAIAEIQALWREHERRTTRLDVSHAFHSHLMEPVLDELGAVVAGVELSEPSVAIVSNVTGERLTAEQACSPEYWVRHVRETVRFADGIRHLQQAGVTRFLELGPDGVLSALAAHTATAEQDELLFAPALRGSKVPQAEALLACLGAAHCHGVEVDWSPLLDGRAAGRVELPTYAFQRQRYWLTPSPTAGSAVAGLTAIEHPLLGTGQPLGGSREWLFTGRLSLATHPWLADHEVAGVVLLPATAFLELALLAARHLGGGDVEKLTLLAPLVLDRQGAVQLQVVVKEPDEDGRRALEVYSRPEAEVADESGDASFTLHASGLLGVATASSAGDAALIDFAAANWPPADAEQLDVELLYDQLADAGYNYGPAFQGLRRAFGDGEEWYAEVAFTDEHDSHAAGFRVHPALVDAALHTMLLASLDRRERDTPPEVPFTLAGVRMRGEGCSALRVRVAVSADAEAGVTTVRLLALDEHGSPALAIEALETRPIDRTALRARSPAADDALFELEWTAPQAAAADGALPRAALLSSGEERRELELAELGLDVHADLQALEQLVASGAPAPDVVLVPAATAAGGTATAADGTATAAGGTAAAAHAVAASTLALLQARLRSEPLAETRLVLLTDGALAVLPGERPNLGQAALLGLMRSAASENPGAFAVIDLDPSDASPAALIAALASEEPELAIRDGRILAPRLAPVAAIEEPSAARELDPSGTILITGGTHGLGALVARHLAAEHGARRLLLVSRRGAEADGVQELVASLAQLGCEARVAACDVVDRAQLQALLAEVPREHPLTAVVHAAGVLADGVITSLDGELLRSVMAPKVDGALNLHELTAGLPLSQFVLFSSVAGTLGVPGQGNYAAANAFLDALAQHRHADGLPATSLAWGTWAGATRMTDAREFDLERWEHAGIAALSERQGMALLDTARGTDRPLLVPVRLERRALRAQARAGTLPAILRGLFGGADGQAKAADGALARRLASAPESEWQPIALEFVLEHVAVVLKHGPGAAIDPRRAFKDLGFDSLSAIELRNRLSQATGLTLPATLIYDYATPAAVAELLRAKVAGTGPSTRVTRSQAQTDEPIAIVGMSCRYPGGVRSPGELWELVLSGTDAIGEFPSDRGWDLERLYDPDPDHPGTSYTRHGGFIYDAGDFDPEFFSISPREALAIDPQHRLLLEGAWEALEDAGIDPLSLRGSDTGVFAGVMHHDYGSAGVPAELEGYIGTGGSLLSGRLAYALGLEGQAVSVDTACSSSLVALHLACQALRRGECGLALAGGATVLWAPTAFVQFSRQRALAPDGRCRAFGAGADGTAWSEGAGLLVLERLSAARQAGHRVLAVVRGSAVNQDGASNGLTAPNGPAQERVIRQALAVAGLSPADVDAVEGHGTGTALGDPIEAQALLATYGRERSNGAGGPLYLGSLKSNIGHTQAAAGVAGVIKMVQALRHGLLPRSLHCEEPSPHVDWSAGDVELLAWPVDWSPGERVRRAGVSSFGISGTNAHVILEEAPRVEGSVIAGGESVPAGVLPFVVSAASGDALGAQAGRLASFLQERSEVGLAGVAGALVGRRARLAHRAVVVAGERDGLVAALRSLERGELPAGVVRGVMSDAGRVAFLFSGQGSQWLGMGAELQRAFPVFADALAEVCAELDGHLERPLLEVMFAEADPGHSAAGELLSNTRYTQVALFALEVSLYRLVRGFGVEPDYLIGHSIGEFAAAHVAGVLSLEDACLLVAERARLMGALPQGGAMLAVEASEEEARESLAGFDGRVALAAVNAPRAVTVSGEAQAIAEIEALWRERGRRTTRLEVSHAFHSHLMEPMLDELGAVVGRLELSDPSIAIVSNVTGERLTAEQARSPEYWVRHVRETVRFADGIRHLRQAGVTRFLELGPDGVLSALAAHTVAAEEDEFLFAPALRGSKVPQEEALLAFLGAAHCHGVDIDWSPLFDPGAAGRVELPTYAFQRQRYWLTPARTAGDLTATGLSAVEHPLLSAMLPLAGRRGTAFSGRISLTAQPWLRDHAVFDRVLFPATAFAELLLVAGAELGCGAVEELTLESPLLLTEGYDVALEVLVGAADGGGRREVEVHSRTQTTAGVAGDAELGEWVRHASGVLSDELRSCAGTARSLDREEWPPRGAEPVDVAAMYDRLADAGFGYGPIFRGAVAAWRRGEETFCEIALGESAAADAAAFAVHPALLDASLHALLDSSICAADGGGVPLPFALRGVRVLRTGARSLRVALTSAAEGRRACALLAVDEAGRTVLEVESISLRPIDVGRLGAAAETGGDALFKHVWVELSPAATAERPPRYAALGEGLDLLPEVARHPDLDALVEAIEHGVDAPDAVFVAREGVTALLGFLQAWLQADAVGEARLVLVTCGAMAVAHGEPPDPARAALWGLARSAQSEHPGRFTLVDLEAGVASPEVDWAALLAAGEPQLAVRGDKVLALRLARLEDGAVLAAPEGDVAWHLDAPGRGTLEGLSLVQSPRAADALAPNEVRVAVRAGGLNFRDVLIALGRYPDDDSIGSEGAGVVLEVGAAVCDLAVGDRVMGLMADAFGPVAVSDRRLLARMPAGWSFAEAASVPVAFLTAYYGLVERAGLRAGERLLVHAGAGGVGMAAIGLARHLGAEVYATASKEKWRVLRELGVEDDHIASSRDLEFRDRFLAATGGEGVDVVLNALAGEPVDASLDLLPRGGRFLELGKADRRDPDQIRRERAGVDYHAYDLLRDAGPDRIGTLLGELLALFEVGALRPLPVRAWDVRHAFEAFRHLGDGRNVGKVVLTVPRSLDPGGTVLITGGTGDLGARVARHLAAEHGVRHLLLVSRRGHDAPGAAELVKELRELGADPLLAACDVTDRDGLTALLGAIDAAHPLTAVVHTAGILDDGLIESLTPAQVGRAFAPKADAARLLHELTRDGDLAEFVLFSSDSGTVGVPGQGNYAAANVFLDALAQWRRAQGLPGTSLAWGLWSKATGMAGDLGDADIARLARLGVAVMSNELELLDAARGAAEPVVVATALDMPALRAAARAGTLPPLMRELVRSRSRGRPDRTRASLVERLMGLAAGDREEAVLQVVLEEAAVVLGYELAERVAPERKFKELGFDSLAGVELRNRLAAVTGLWLPSTLVFDHPSPAAAADYLLSKLAPALAPESPPAPALAPPPPQERPDLENLDAGDLVRLARTG